MKQGTTAKTVRWPHVLHHFQHYHMEADFQRCEMVTSFAKKCQNVRFQWLESVLWAGVENYSIIIMTFTVCAIQVATFLVV
jgi:hypothetical protein